MRYVTIPKDIATDLVTRGDSPTPVIITFVVWLRGVFAMKQWSDGTNAEAATKLGALDTLMTKCADLKPLDVVALTDDEHEQLSTHARLFEVGESFATERHKLQRFKLAIAAAPSTAPVVAVEKATNGAPAAAAS